MPTDKQIHILGKQFSLRSVLMIVGIGIVVLASAWFYLTSGRYVSTEDAYIKAAKVLVTPQVSGEIIAVPITDNQMVTKGQMLFQIDPRPYEIAKSNAEAALKESFFQIQQLKAQYKQMIASLGKAKANYDYMNKEYERKLPLIKSRTISSADFDQAKQQRDIAFQEVELTKQQIKQLKDELAGDPDIEPEDHPTYKKVLATLNAAKLNLAYTTVQAAKTGFVGQAPHVGDYASAGLPVLNFIEKGKVWIDANYKETELTNVKVGQPASITVDTYPDHTWQGTVESISPATGSEFSILPAQNSTGNWVKVVQRIIVRIRIDKGPQDIILRTGMSTFVTIDVGFYPHLP